MDAKIISFPEEKIVRYKQTEEVETEQEIKLRTEIMRTLHVQEVIETLMPIIFSQLAVGGFDVSEMADIKDAAFITEAIRSVLCKQKGLDHPFQQLADKIFTDDNDGILSVVDCININFKPDTEQLDEVAPTT